jgi:hypothetical protein
MSGASVHPGSSTMASVPPEIADLTIRFGPDYGALKRRCRHRRRGGRAASDLTEAAHHALSARGQSIKVLVKQSFPADVHQISTFVNDETRSRSTGKPL